jgi:subtilisin family serine protease
MVHGGFVMHQAMVLLDPAVKARVLLVGAANRDGTDIWGLGQDPRAWGGATLVSGVTDILAPAEDILTLVRPQDFNGASVKSGSGTSFAAPMVSGTAALLWAFDPTLTANEVKGYILDGAKERMSATGTIEPSPVIPNSGGLNLLDAYGALTLLSRERPGTTPICGGQVWASRHRSTSIRERLSSG